MGDKGLYNLSSGLSERWRAAELGGVGFNASWIEVVSANQQTQLVAQSRLTVTRAIMQVGLARLAILRVGFAAAGSRSQFLDRTQSDPVRLTQCPIHGSRFGDAHFCALH